MPVPKVVIARIAINRIARLVALLLVSLHPPALAPLSSHHQGQGGHFILEVPCPVQNLGPPKYVFSKWNGFAFVATVGLSTSI